MNRTQFFLCLFGITVGFFLKDAKARPARLPTQGIVGGDDAYGGQFPYQVSLQSDGESFCGGSILSERFILTAAHCVVESDNSFTGDSIKVVAGISNLNSNLGRVVIDVVKVFVPNEYDRTLRKATETFIGDIAILMLNEDLPIKDNSKLGKVKLPKKDETYEGKIATFSGFGDNEIELVTDPKTGNTEEINAVSFHEMRFAKSKIYSYEICQKFYEIKKFHLCAAVVQRDKKHPEGVCAGDSGGPLVHDGVQIGVLSLSPPGCSESTEPAIYTRVTDYLDFIVKVINGKTDESIRNVTLEVAA